MVQNDTSICFVALARDCAKHLPKFRSILENFDQAGLQWRAVVGENDSKDGTREILNKYCEEDSRIELVDTSLMSKISGRLPRMAFGRQLLLEVIKKKNYSSVDYVVVIDIDNVINPDIDTKVFEKSFDVLKENKFFAVSATSVPFYYDLIALRDGIHNTSDIISNLNKLGRSPLNYYFYHKNVLYPMQKQIADRGSFECQSAFNGLCIYPYDKYVSGSYYEGNGKDVCEHVIFNEVLNELYGGNVFACSDLRVNVPKDHAMQSFAVFFMNRLIKMTRRMVGKISL